MCGFCVLKKFYRSVIMTSPHHLPVRLRRMNGHVKNMHLQKFMELAARLLSFLLLVNANSTKTVATGRNPQCEYAQQPWKLTRLVQRESVELIKTYKASQGEMTELFCKVSVNNIPDPNTSGLELADRIASIYEHLQAFLPHFKRVYEQQTDLQPPTSPLLTKLTCVTDHSRNLVYLITNLYHNLFPNSPLPEPAGAPTTLPPPMNVFQQKIYGCAVLKTYKELLANILRDLRNLKKKVCTKKDLRKQRKLITRLSI